MTVVHAPPRAHRCAPGVTEMVATGDGGPLALPVGMRFVVWPTPWDYPRGTVWLCDDCGRTWVSLGSPAINAPGVCRFRREGRFERWRRERGGAGV